MDTWIENYFEYYRKAIFDSNVNEQLNAFKKLCEDVKARNGKLILAGNGASMSIASHAATDFTKQAGVRAMCLSDSNMITAFANDYGYEHWVERAIDFYATEEDAVILISSSGKSKNLVNAASFASEKKIKVITFTGFTNDNPLKSLGDINFWLDSRAYNIIECTHMIWITTVVDMIIGKAEYTVS